MENISSKVVEKMKHPVKIMQFGEGNFLRAFIDWIVDSMNKKANFNAGVVVVQPMPFGRVKELSEADGLYTLYLQGINNGQTTKTHQVIDCLEDFINPFTEYQKYLDYAKSKDLEYIISNTTEAGITFDPNDTDFSKTPNSFPGKLLAFLKARYDYFKGDTSKGLEIIPCELIDHNGDTLKETLVKLANHNHMDAKFISWVENANRYYNTLVDRIVPGYPRNEDKELWSQLGYIDNNMVVGEIFHLWVIDGKTVKDLEKKLPTKQADLNVLFVESIKPYKERKVKILNGSHTCLVPVSYLSGIDTVRETIEDRELNKFVLDFIFNEVVPTINIPRDQMDSYANSVLERYGNPFVRHELMSIALNSVTKYKTRILPTVLQNLEDLKHFPDHALFSLAALMVFYRGKRGDEDIKLADDAWALDMFKELWASFDGSKAACEKIAKHVLSLESHWETDLTKYDGVLNFVTDSLYEITSSSMREALAKMVK
ncbi:MAG: tagaturonate reductase [Roseburia sp.]|nr:tagaturonate reductase [Anaeroplasma bactoclasticum]MCM1195749.1 tagaturonate reductase [Roseburia sp.]MCM1557670.1 tagaturonate reductase [Anaeroplasma bactoclasticum]